MAVDYLRPNSLNAKNSAFRVMSRSCAGSSVKATFMAAAIAIVVMVASNTDIVCSVVVGILRISDYSTVDNRGNPKKIVFILRLWGYNSLEVNNGK